MHCLGLMLFLLRVGIFRSWTVGVFELIPVGKNALLFVVLVLSCDFQKPNPNIRLQYFISSQEWLSECVC